MEFDLTNPLLQRHQSSVKAQIQKYFALEKEFMAAPCYSTEHHFDALRPMALSYVTQFSRDQVDAFVPFLAVNYIDRFLSRNITIPIVEHGEGFEYNLQLFVFCCLSIASKIRCSEFSFQDFLNKHQVAKPMKVFVMELQILEGLEWRVRPVTAITFLSFLLPLVKTEDLQQSLPTTTVASIIVAIQKDIKFTKFRHSTLAAAALLLASYRLHPERHFEFSPKVFKCGFIERVEVDRCFNALKDHPIPDYALNPNCRPRVFIGKERWVFRQNKGKGLLIQDSASEPAIAEPAQIHGPTNEIEEEEPEIHMAFETNWHEEEPKPVEEEKYNPMQHIMMCLLPIVCKCFGYEIRPKSK